MTMLGTLALARAALPAIMAAALALAVAGPGGRCARADTPAEPQVVDARYRTAPGMVWIQVESRPDLATTLERARILSLTYEHTAAFETATGWYAIVIGVAEEELAPGILAALKAAAAIPGDSLLTTGRTYLVQVWPRDTTTAEAGLGAAIARERSWGIETRKGVQNALIWTGDYNGVLDGKIGPGTRAAIRAFQQRHGFATTGYLTGEQIVLLEERRVAAVQAAGFEIVDDYDTGIRIGLPLAMFRRGTRDGPFVQFDPRPGQPPASLALLSVGGGPTDLRWLFDLAKRQVGAEPDTYAVLRDDWFVVSGDSDGVTSYMHARAGHGAIKGFLLVWPEGMERTFRPIATAMYNSFEPIPGVVLPPWTEPDDAVAARVDPAPRDAETGSRSATPAPDDGLVATGTGVVVDSAGRILTNAHVVEDCGAVGVAEDISAHVVATDTTVDLALIQADAGDWPDFARFAARPARLNSDVTVVGFPLYGLLGGLNVTRGSVSAAAGLGNDPLRFQITAAVQPGNSGGPVLDRQGAVIGIVQSKLDAIVVAGTIGDIPQTINFAIRGAAAKVFLARHNVDFALAMSGETLAPADLAEEAQRFTVLVRCLAR